MNECFLIGEIISDIDFEFILNSINISIVSFKIRRWKYNYCKRI